MPDFNAHAEYRTTEDIDDDLIDALSSLHPATARSPRGWVEVFVTLPAATIQAATRDALAALSAATRHELLSFEVVETEEFDLRGPSAVIPPLLSVTQAAAALGVSEQAVRKRLDTGTLAGVKVGATWVVPAAAI